MNKSKSTTFKFRVDSNLKNQAAKELNALGITMSDAIRLYHCQLLANIRKNQMFAT